MKKKQNSAPKKHNSTPWLILVFLVGLALLLYPSVSNYWNSFHSSRAITTYAEAVADINTDVYDELWQEAVEYNRTIRSIGVQWEMSEVLRERYLKLLDITGTGIMGYIEISSINCTLPIYHGTSDPVLQVAVGHIEGSSLPVGGEGSHCILSGHRGLPSARLFTDLDKLGEGDTFVIRTLDEVLTYEVDQIRIVMPYELGDLQVVDGKDYCTLVTCTPYGINTHRLLVRGHRIENEADAPMIRITGDAFQIDPLLVAPVVSMPMLVILLVMLFTSGGKKKKNKPRHRKQTRQGDEASHVEDVRE